MPSLLAGYEKEICDNFREAAAGLEVEFETQVRMASVQGEAVPVIKHGINLTGLTGQKDAIDDVFDEAYSLVDELYDREEDSVLNSQAVIAVNVLHMIALHDRAHFSFAGGEPMPDGENFYD